MSHWTSGYIATLSRSRRWFNSAMGYYDRTRDTMPRSWDEKPDKGPPIEEPSLRHKRKSGHSTFKIEYRYIGPTWGPLRNKWQPWNGYSTEKRRDIALATLQRKATPNLEYRKQCPDPPVAKNQSPN